MTGTMRPGDRRVAPHFGDVPRFGRRAFLAAIGSIAAGTALTATSGCRAAPPSSAAETRHLRVELVADPPTVRALLERAVRGHAEQGGYTVEISFVSPDDPSRRYAPAAPPLPDVMLLPTLGSARLFWDASLLDVTEAAERLVRQNGEMPQSLRRALTFEKKLWAVPLYTRAWGWLLRKDLADAAGLTVPSTLAEAMDVASRLAEPSRGISGWALPLLRSSEGESFVHQVILGYGGALADEGGRRVALESGETIEAVRFLSDLLRARHGPAGPASAGETTAPSPVPAHEPPAVVSGGAPGPRTALPSNPREWTREGREAAFLAGRIALAPVSAELYSRIRREERFPAKALQVVSPPGGPKRRTTTAEGRHLAVSAHTRHPELCLDLIAALVSPTQLRRLLLESEGAAVPAYADLTHDPFWDADPLRPGFAVNARGDLSRRLEMVEYGHPGPATPAAGDVAAELLLSGMVLRCAEEGIVPETAVREAHRRAERIYEAVAVELARARRGRSK